MSEIVIRRRARLQICTIGTSTSTATTIRTDDMAAGTLHVVGLSTAVTSIALWAAPTRDGPYTALMSADGSAIEITTTTAQPGCYTLPDAVHGLHWLKLVADADVGTASATITMSS